MTAPVAGLVLAAGAGARFGGPKAVAELGGERLVDRAVRALRDGGVAPVVVVAGATAVEVAGATVIDNAAWAEGMGSSLRAGLARLDGLAAELEGSGVHLVGAAVLLVDQPGVTAAAVARVLAEVRDSSSLVVATYTGRHGHPVVLGRAHWAEVAALARGDRGARDFLRAHDADLVRVECSDVARGDDVDTADQLAAWAATEPGVSAGGSARLGAAGAYGGRVQVAYRTEIGHVRARNEDAVLARPERGILAVADGLGGHPAGDVASLTAMRSLDHAALTGRSTPEQLAEAARVAHEAVLAAGQEPDRRGMGTTLVLAAVTDSRATVLHVGDSRAYLLGPTGDLRALTRDHGMHGYLTQALGLDRDVEPDVAEVDCPPGSRLLLCTDGLTNMVEDRGIGDLLGRGDAQQACDALVEAALAGGGVDNVTVVVAAF